MTIPIDVDVILVPRGWEYRAVRRGLDVTGASPKVLPIPLGVRTLTTDIAQLQGSVLLMGLCGSLSSEYEVGDILLYRDCVGVLKESELLVRSCDRALTSLVYNKLQPKISSVRGLTSDRLIWSAAEKCQLHQNYNAAVVDMEGLAILEALSRSGMAVAMLRVVSDDCHNNIPDLSAAITVDRKLQPLQAAFAFLRQPRAAFRLIRGSLRGLKILRQTTTRLFYYSENEN